MKDDSKLIGESGDGKAALVEGIANHMVKGDTPSDCSYFETSFLNSALYREIKEKCEKEPDKVHTVVIDQGSLTDEEYRKRVEYIQSLVNSGVLPTNFRFSILKNDSDELPEELRSRFQKIDFTPGTSVGIPHETNHIFDPEDDKHPHR